MQIVTILLSMVQKLPILNVEGVKINFARLFYEHLRRSATQNLLISQLCFTVLKMKLYVCRNLCEIFRQIGQKMKKLASLAYSLILSYTI